MAGSPQPEPEQPKLGAKATVAGLIFALLVLGGFGAAVAAQADDDGHGDESHETHDEDGEDHSDEAHGEDDDH